MEADAGAWLMETPICPVCGTAEGPWPSDALACWPCHMGAMHGVPREGILYQKEEFLLVTRLAVALKARTGCTFPEALRQLQDMRRKFQVVP